MSPEPEQHLEERLNSEVEEGEIRTHLVNPYDQIEFLSNSLQNEWTLCIFFFHVAADEYCTYKEMLKHFLWYPNSTKDFLALCNWLVTNSRFDIDQ